MKKGIVIKSTDSASKVNLVNPSWYYTWGLKEISGVQPNIPFVPMIWGKGVTQDHFDTVIAINEPDRPDQSDMTVDEAVATWSMISANRKGSPATAGNALSSKWFEEFMSKVHPDFICVHWYGPPHPESLLSLVDGLTIKYLLPIWITEFAVAQWNPTKPAYTVDQVADFMRAVIPELEKRPHVERYAWKTRPQRDLYMGSSALFRDDGNLTDLGQLYRDM